MSFNVLWMDNVGATAYHGHDYRAFLKGLFVKAGALGIADLRVSQVTPSATANAQIAPGTYVIDASATTGRGYYVFSNSANYVLTMPSANATNPRIDVVGILINDAEYAGEGAPSGVPYVQPGTAAPSPTVPTYSGVGIFTPLADVLRPAANSTVTSANMTFRSEYSAARGGVVASYSTQMPIAPHSGDMVLQVDTGTLLKRNPGNTAYDTLWTTDAWGTFTPNFGSSGTAPSMIVGGRLGTYSISTNRTVHAEARFAWTLLGSGEGLGTGTYRLGLPLQAGTQYVSQQSTLGTGIYTDTGTLQYGCTAVFDSGGGVHCVYLLTGAAGAVTEASPGAQANLDWMTYNVTYQAA